MKKTVVVTGASKGIGAQIARDFADAGYNVIVNYLTSEKEAQALASEIGGIAVKADVSIEEEAKMLIDTAVEKFGGIDILVNNAGVSNGQQLFGDLSWAEWKKLFSVNVDGVFNCSKAASDYMITNHSGKIINISSIWGICGASCEVAYSTTKAAVIGFTKALAKELGPSGIQVNCVAPGVIMTDMNAHLDKETIDLLKEETPLCKVGTVEDVSKTVLFLASSGGDFITGQVISPNGGIVI